MTKAKQETKIGMMERWNDGKRRQNRKLTSGVKPLDIAALITNTPILHFSNTPNLHGVVDVKRYSLYNSSEHG
jgi:hypothetical protein